MTFEVLLGMMVWICRGGMLWVQGQQWLLPLVQGQGLTNPPHFGQGQQHWVVHRQSKWWLLIAASVFDFTSPVIPSLSSCLCQTELCLFHFYSYSNCFKALTSSAPFFSDFSGFPDIFPAEPWPAQCEHFKVIAHCGSASHIVGKTSHFTPSFLSCWFLIIHLLFWQLLLV